MAQWKGLRKIAFSYAFDINWTWGTTSPYLDPGPHIDVVNEYLDDVDPTWQGGPYSLNMVRKDYPDLCDDIEERIRTILPDEETIDPNDRTLILRVWEILHYHRVANVMSSLVEKCPTLEEIEWFPMAVSERDGEGETKSLWKWKVQQGIRGHYGPHRVSGSYTYKRCPSGDPPPLYILVGEELKRTLEQRVRKY